MASCKYSCSEKLGQRNRKCSHYEENSVLKYIRIIVLPSQDNNVIFSFSEIDEVFFFRPIATNGHLTQLRYNKVSQSVGRAGMRQVPLSRLNFLCHNLNILCRSCLNFLCCCFTGVFIAESDVGVGTIVGSAVFNILFIVGVCGLFAGMVSFPFLEKRRIHSRTLIYYSASYHSCELYTGVLCNCSVLNLVRNAKTVRFPITLWGNSSQNAKHIFFLSVKIQRWI